MGQRRVGLTLFLLGLVVVLIGLLGDPLGLGRAPGLGWKQLTAAVIGGLVAIAGGYLVSRRR